MFGHTSPPSRNWTFGAKAPLLNLDSVREQMRAGHRYRNALVALERERREKVDAKLRALFPALHALEAEIAAAEADLGALRVAIKADNAKRRSRHATPEQVADSKRLKSLLRDLRARRKIARAEAFRSPEWELAQTTINEWASTEAKALRAASGLYWGTYLCVEQSMQGARSGPPPVFQSWRGDGRVCVQIQPGLDFAALLSAQDRRLRIEVTGRRAVCYLRIGSEGREPIWCAAPVTLHRDLPADALVKWATLRRRRIGTQDEWSLQLTLARAAGWEYTDRASAGQVGIDIGWRLRPSGLRVAYWVGSDGAEGELVLPTDDVGRWAYADRLRSIQGLHFDAIRPVLAAWFRGREHPPWLTMRGVETLSQWRSEARLSALVFEWRSNRLPGDADPHPEAAALRELLQLDHRHYGTPESIFDLAAAWRTKSRHLYNWECSQRVKATRWRDNLYRNFAADMRRRYRTVRLEKLDLSRLAKTPEAEEPSIDQALREYRMVASCGRLRQLLAECMTVETFPARHTTQRCHACGALSGESAPANLLHSCAHCGAEWDQDRNAALNLLHGERSGGAWAEATP